MPAVVADDDKIGPGAMKIAGEQQLRVGDDNRVMGMR
jgi:hypothetical protein